MKKALRGCARLCLVAGVVLLIRHRRTREYHFGRPDYQKPLLAKLVTSCLFPFAYKCKHLTVHEIKKTGELSYTGFLVLAGVDEISNFDLLKDLAEVVDFLTTL